MENKMSQFLKQKIEVLVKIMAGYSKGQISSFYILETLLKCFNFYLCWNHYIDIKVCLYKNIKWGCKNNFMYWKNYFDFIETKFNC